MPAELFVHETSYQRRNLAGLIHRDRLRTVSRTLARFVEPSTSSWADVGCSNGFIIHEIVAQKRYVFRRIVGLDHAQELLERARAKGIPRAEFQHIDLNEVRGATERFDLVTCLETLEHVGHVENAVANLVDRVLPGGLLLVTVPNETGVSGLVKLCGRLAVRRNPYGDFFAGGRRMEYVMRLVCSRRIDGFRLPGRPGYGPHLGFDYRTLRDHLRQRYVARGVLEPLLDRFTLLGMNVLFLFRKASG